MTVLVTCSSCVIIDCRVYYLTSSSIAYSSGITARFCLRCFLNLFTIRTFYNCRTWAHKSTWTCFCAPISYWYHRSSNRFTSRSVVTIGLSDTKVSICCSLSIDPWTICTVITCSSNDLLGTDIVWIGSCLIARVSIPAGSSDDSDWYWCESGESDLVHKKKDKK